MTSLLLRRARLPERDDLADILIEGGTITAISPTTGPTTAATIAAAVTPAAVAANTTVRDCAGGLVWPGFVDVHTHLDKGHIWPRAANPDGTFQGALSTVAADRGVNWTAADVARRFEFGLRCAHAHGTVAMRTHLDSPPAQFRTTWPVFARLRAAWAGRITLQGVALTGLALLDDQAYARDLAMCVAEHGGIMGAVISPMENLADRIDALIRLAERHDLALDLHIDETLDPAARSVKIVAERVIAHRFERPILLGHCCSLSVQDDIEIERTLDLMAQARLAVVSLPMCNLYLQDRVPGRTPRRRGVTLLHELTARGIAAAVASDNCRDPFYAYGDHDMLEVFREATRIAHLDHPVGVWPRTVNRTAAEIMRLEPNTTKPGAVADLIVFRARNMSELLARPQADRTVLRAGVPIDTTLPDYAELDDLMR